jgi:hypothetical protein
MGFIYLWGVLLPILLAWGRYRCELHAESAYWRYHFKYRALSADEIKKGARSFAETIAGKSYLWAWPRPWVVWGFERRAKKVIRQVIRDTLNSAGMQQ